MLMKIVVAAVTIAAGANSFVWAQPSLKVSDSDGREISIAPMEHPNVLTVKAFTYLYLPDHKSYSPLRDVKVIVIPIERDKVPRFIDWTTGDDGVIEFDVEPYEPLHVMFQYDKALEFDEFSTEVDHLMPVTAFLAGRPSQKMKLHVALMTIRDILDHYGEETFFRLYHMLGLSLAGAEELRADVLAYVLGDAREVCIGRASRDDARRDRLVDFCGKIS